MDRISLNLTTDHRPVSVAELSLQSHSAKPNRLVAFPVRANRIRDAIAEMLPSGRVLKVVDEFHALEASTFEYIGLFATINRDIDDFQWAISAYCNPHGNFIKLHSGIFFPKFRCTLSFHASDVAVENAGAMTDADLALFVNESLGRLQSEYLLEFERMKHYKNCILARKEAHDVICVAIEREVFAGRLAAEFLEVWHKQGHKYTTPRTGWSLFCEVSWLLNRLKAAVMIERTINAHSFFDEAFGFNKKALGTVWRQETFA